MPAVIKPDLFFCSLSLVWTVWGDAFAAAAIGIVPVRIRVEPPPCAQPTAVPMRWMDFYWKVWMELIVFVDVAVVVVVVGDDRREE